MVPKINQQGHSFKGVIAYLMHDKKSLDTSERVRWFETGNMTTPDPEKAAKIMAFTDLSSDHLKEQSGGVRPEERQKKALFITFLYRGTGMKSRTQNTSRNTLLKRLKD